MKLKELKSLLRAHPEALPRFVLPDGDTIPQHFHVTEVGYVTKRFIDCGGKLHDRKEICLLQTHVADDVDHRLNSSTFGKILDLGAQVLPHDGLDVEVEYEDGIATQAPITSAYFTGRHIELQLGEKHTACLAQQRRRMKRESSGSDANAGTAGATSCC